MKAIYSVFLLILLVGCARKADNDPLYGLGANAIFGKWKMIGYADSKEISYDVTIEIKNEKDQNGRYIISGKTPLNFYFATFDIDPDNRTIRLYDVVSTTIKGDSQTELLEKNYYELLAKVVSYEKSSDGKQLTLQLPQSDKQAIRYAFSGY